MHKPHWGHIKHSWAFSLYVKQDHAEEEDAWLPIPLGRKVKLKISDTDRKVMQYG